MHKEPLPYPVRCNFQFLSRFMLAYARDGKDKTRECIDCIAKKTIPNAYDLTTQRKAFNSENPPCTVFTSGAGDHR